MTNADAALPRRPRWLIAAAVILLLMAAMHMVALVQDPAPQSADETTMYSLMRSVKLPLPGAPDRTMMQILTGFSTFLSAGCLGLGLTVLLIALARPEPGIVRRTAIGVGIALAIFLAISLKYFFLIPTAMFGLGLLLAIVSYLRDVRIRSA